MIHYLKIKNFLSIRDEVTLSFEATLEHNLRNLYIRRQCGLNLLRLGAIYGANASGKSNVLEAFRFFRTLVLRKPNNKNVGTGVIPFLLDDIHKEEPSEFEISFITKNKRYTLFLQLDGDKIIKEILKVYISQKPSTLYERTFNRGISEIVFNSRLKFREEIKNEIKAKCLQNMTVLSAYNQVNTTCVDFDNVNEWFAKNIHQPINSNTSLLDFAKKRLRSNDILRDAVVSDLRSADFNITAITIDTKNIPKKVIEDIIKMRDLLLPDNSELITEERIQQDNLQATFTHSVVEDNNVKNFRLSEDLESIGTKRMLGLSTVLNMLKQKDSFITIDEIESSMHPKLVEHVIAEFLNTDTESQLLFTTHYDGLLDAEDILRKDTIWFTNKEKDASTQLYCLSDFKNIRKTSLRKAYRSGYFYAQPNI